MVKYHWRLQYGEPRPTYVVINACHQRKMIQEKTIYDDDNNDRVRQCSTAKYVGFNFWVKIVKPIKEYLVIEIFINKGYNGNELGSKNRWLFLTCLSKHNR